VPALLLTFVLNLREFATEFTKPRSTGTFCPQLLRSSLLVVFVACNLRFAYFQALLVNTVGSM
jgi:hypothetical protein